MNFPYIISAIFLIVLSIFANSYFFKLEAMPFIGLVLVCLLVFSLIVNFSGKINRKRKGVKGEPDSFIFPESTAKKMKTMSLEIQYETSVLSSALLMVGMVLFLIYFTFFTNSSWVLKGLIIFNSVCGLGLMGGMLITYYQQLVSYRESVKFLHTFSANQIPEIEQPEEQQDLYDNQPVFEDEQEYYDYFDPNYQQKGGRK